MKPSLHNPCFLVVVTGALAALTACSSQVRGTSHDPPPRPAIGAPIDRVGRPLTANALIGLTTSDDVADRRKEQYDRAGEAEWPQFVADIEPSLAVYDGFDGRCGNQWLADASAAPALRYHRLAELLVDDRLWIDARAPVCRQLFAVERAALAAPSSPASDCGGRTLTDDAVDVYRSLLVLGATSGVEDGLARDDRDHASAEFPFVAPP